MSDFFFPRKLDAWRSAAGKFKVGCCRDRGKVMPLFSPLRRVSTRYSFSFLPRSCNRGVRVLRAFRLGAIPWGKGGGDRGGAATWLHCSRLCSSFLLVKGLIFASGKSLTNSDAVEMPEILHLCSKGLRTIYSAE